MIFCFANTYYLHFHLDENLIKTLSNPIISEFFMGCFVAWIYRKHFLFYSYSPIFIIVGIVLFILSAIYRHDIATCREVFFGLPAALIIYGVIDIKKYIPRFLVYLGDASYTIYLFHCLIIGLIIKFVVLLKLTSYVANGYGLIITALITIFISCLIYEWIEKPILQFNKNVMALYVQFRLRSRVTTQPEVETLF